MARALLKPLLLFMNQRKETELSNTKERLAYSPKNFAELADLSLSFVKREIYAGNLKAIKRGGRVIIPAEAARAYLSGESETRNQEQLTTVSA